jgi:hypothetical protein
MRRLRVPEEAAREASQEEVGATQHDAVDGWARL